MTRIDLLPKYGRGTDWIKHCLAVAGEKRLGLLDRDFVPSTIDEKGAGERLPFQG